MEDAVPDIGDHILHCHLCGRDASINAVGYDVLLVSCSYEKLDHPSEARELYQADRFRLARRYAERSPQPWFIVSGEHALVRPTDWLAPYDTDLSDLPEQYRVAWGQWVVAKLARLCDGLDGLVIEIHAPQSYVDPMVAPFESAGATLQLPLDGVPWDDWARWYRQVLETAHVPEDDSIER